jgi:hypothetical protein
MNTVWTPDQKRKPDAETAAKLLSEAIKYHEEAHGRLESVYKTLTGEWPMRYGLDITDRFDTRKPEDYVFGSALPFDVLQEDGNWTKYLPPPEWQSVWGEVTFETSACATYGTLNALEILIARKYGRQADKSDRFLATVSGTTIQGNSPQRVGETLRKLGVPLEEEWPASGATSFTEWYQTPPPSVYEKARKFLDKYNVKHEYVKPQDIEEALKTSPLGISVYAWIKQGGEYVHPVGANDNHWCVLIACTPEHFIVYDTYEDDGSPLKKVRRDYVPMIIKRYWIQEREEPRKRGWRNVWAEIKALLRRVWDELWITPVIGKAQK